MTTEVKIIKPKGSKFWLVFWLIVLPPVGIIYFFQRSWKKSK